jgi:ribokinase
MAEVDAVYITAGDRDAIRMAGRARRVVATVRAAESLFDSGIGIDALVASRNDPGESVESGDFRVPPEAIVRTDGRRGGTIESADGTITNWPAMPPPPSRVDSYGAGDSFAGGLTFGLGLGLPLPEAVSLGAFCGAKNLTGRGPYPGQATAADLAEWRSFRD